MNAAVPLSRPDSGRTLTFAEAIRRYGSRWERSPDGSSIRELLIENGMQVPAGQREVVCQRAQTSLRIRRAELERQIAELRDRLSMKGEVFGARFLFRDILRGIQAEIKDRERRLQAIPEMPRVDSLDPDAESGIPVDALGVGDRLWLVDSATAELRTDRVTHVTFDGAGIRYRALGGVEVLHQAAGLVELSDQGVIPCVARRDAERQAAVIRKGPRAPARA